jgi:hypothetical protein
MGAIWHQIIGASIEVHRTPGGPGLLESIYEAAFLRLTGIKLGLLVNFGAPYVKDGVSRIINGILSLCLIAFEVLKEVEYKKAYIQMSREAHPGYR